MSGGPGPAHGGPRIRVASGARSVEGLLLADVLALLPGSAAEAELLARPVVVVVPSRSLRLHVAERLVATRGRAAAGVEIVTLHALASAIVARCHARRADGTQLLPVLVGRFAARQPALRDLAATLEDGELPVVASVRDLLDAGFTPAGADALLELLRDHRDRAERERAEALVRVASAVVRVLEAAETDLASDLLRRATGLLRDDPERALPSRAVLVHGFADATGVATDLIETLLRERGAWVYLDQPPDPAEPSSADLGTAFSERFVGRLRGVASLEPAAPAAPGGGDLALFQAMGAHGEVREVARRIRALLDAGTAPERIAVVARDLTPYAFAIQTHFTRLAVPFSALGTPGSLDAAARRRRALVRVLRRGTQAPVDAWLGAASLEGYDLRLGLHACGAARVHDVAALAPEAVLDANGELVLPVRRGLAELPGETGGEGNGDRHVAPRRRLAGARLRRAVRLASQFVALLETWPAQASPAEHLVRLQKLLRDGLGWRDRRAGAAEVLDLLSTLAVELAVAPALSREEFLMLVRRAIEGIATPTLGGAGGGVQVLSVIEARARTFAALFLLGLNRDSFPRPVREDPLLPDRLRQAIERDVLPQVPIKRLGFDEERFLFAQLVSSSGNVTVSWQTCDDDGRALPPSPLVERLRLAGGAASASVRGAALPEGAGELATPEEHAVLAGLHLTRAQFGRVLAVACAQDAGGEGGARAAARLAVLEELDPDRRTPEGRARAAALGPYFGFVGAPRERADPRRGAPAVTTIENVASCPWQAFLRRVLRLEPPPDPLAAAPGVDPLLLGQGVHRVLEAIVSAGGGELARSVGGALRARPVPVPWPAAEEVERLVREVCTRLAREEGLTLPGLDRLLAERVRPFLAVAGRVLWAGAGIAVLGAEAEGTVTVVDAAGTPRPLGYRADLVFKEGDAVAFTDFKTGAPLSKGKKADTRERDLIRAIASGRALQAAAYAAGSGERSAEGRYLFLRPDLDDDLRSLTVASDAPAPAEAFRGAVETALAAWDAGALFPRLERADLAEEPARCRWCEVREACVRGDSGARRRLARWAAAPEALPQGRLDAENALRRLWHLGSAAEEAE